MPSRFLFICLALTALVCSAPLSAQDSSQAVITEWEVPWADSRPRDPDIAPNGEIWFVGQASDYVSRFDRGSGAFTKSDLPSGAGPHNLVVARDAMLWVAGNRQGWIGRLNPNTGELNRVQMPEGVEDPHTLVLNRRGQVWFTAQWSNAVGRLDPDTGKIDIVKLPVEKSRPYGIRLAAGGRPWVALLGTNALMTVDPLTLIPELIYLPRPGARLRRVAITDDGAIWYSDYAEGYIGRYDPESGDISEWKTPSERSGPYAMAEDRDGRIWFVETWPDPNQLVGFDPESEHFFSITPIASGGGSVRHMVYDEENHSLWFGTDSNTIAEAVLPP